MDPRTIEIMIAAAVIIVGNGGAAWAGMKRAMNGINTRLEYMMVQQNDLKEGQDDLGQDLRDLREEVHCIDTKVAVLETRLEN